SVSSPLPRCRRLSLGVVVSPSIAVVSPSASSSPSASLLSSSSILALCQCLGRIKSGGCHIAKYIHPQIALDNLRCIDILCTVHTKSINSFRQHSANPCHYIPINPIVANHVYANRSIPSSDAEACILDSVSIDPSFLQ